MRKVIAGVILFTLILTGCGEEPVPPEPVTDPFANIVLPVENEYYYKVNEPKPSLKLDSVDIKNKETYDAITVEAYTQYKECTTVVTSTKEYYVKSKKDAVLLFECANRGISTMAKINRKGVITKWYAVFEGMWFAPASKDDITNIYRVLLGDCSDPDYPLTIGTTGSIAGDIKSYSDNILTVSVKGTTYDLIVSDQLYEIGSYYTKDFSVVTGGALQASDYIATESTEDNSLEYVCPVGYSRIKPLDYAFASATTEVNEIDIKGGGTYTTDTWQTAELLTLAYYSDLEVYIKTGDNLFQIDDYILVDRRKELSIKTAEELMNYVNAKSAPDMKRGTYKSKMKLLTVTPSINLYEGVSDLDAIDKRPFYSYHYSVFEDKNYNRYILRYTSGSKGIDYLDLPKYRNKEVVCKYTYFTLHDIDGEHLNYVIDGVSE